MVDGSLLVARNVYWRGSLSHPIRHTVQICRKNNYASTEQKAESNLEFEEPHAEKKAKNNTDARSKILGDIVSVVDAHRNQHPTTGLTEYCCPHNRIVPIKEPILGDLLSILEHNPDYQSWE